MQLIDHSIDGGIPDEDNLDEQASTEPRKGDMPTDVLSLPGGPITRARAKKFKESLGLLIQELWAKPIIPQGKSPMEAQNVIHIIS